jgi:peroxiredoxin
MSEPRTDFYDLPADLPVPRDDGASAHLEGTLLPDLVLRSTSNRQVNLREATQHRTVIFFYPRTGRPDENPPMGWDEIPGARGCTPQSCAFRDLHAEFKKLGVDVYGLSTQTTEYQLELANRIHLPYALLSDAGFKLTNELGLPTFVFGEIRLLKRMAWVCESGKIVKVFYPVFPPDRNAGDVLKWIQVASQSR